MSTSAKQLFFSLLLLFTAAVWGSGFLVMQDVQEIVPINYVLAVRFSVAALGLVYFVYADRANFGWDKIWQGMVTGGLIYLAYWVQSYGLFFTTVSNNAVLCALYVVMVPFLVWFVRKQSLSWRIYASAFTCLLGVILVAAPDGMDKINSGDALALTSSFLYALHMVVVSIYSEKTEVMSLTCLQFAFAGLFAFIVASFGKPWPQHLEPSAYYSLAWLSIMATLMAITMMNIGIKYVSSSKTAIILSTESVFACIFGVIFKDEPITANLVVGVILVFVAMVASQLEPSKESKRNKAEILRANSNTLKATA